MIENCGDCMEAFQINACMKNGRFEPLTKGFNAAEQYLAEHQLVPAEQQMLLIGRALTDLSADDVLYTSDGHMIQIHWFHLYGKQSHAVGACQLCVMACSVTDEPFSDGEILFLR